MGGYKNQMVVKMCNEDYIDLIKAKVDDAQEYAEKGRYMDESAIMGLSSMKSTESIKDHMKRRVEKTADGELMEAMFMIHKYFRCRGIDSWELLRTFQRIKEEE